MTEDPKLYPDRSDEEKAAAAELLRAKARREIAEAEASELAVKEERARLTEIEIRLRNMVEQEEARRAGDEFHHIYRFSTPVSDQTVKTCIQKLTEWHRLNPGCTIEVIFNSPGGGVISGLELFDFLVDLHDKGHEVITGCTGFAASMAGILVQAGSKRWMSKESWYMIHRTAFGAIGKSYEVEDTLEWVKRIEKRVVDIFVSRSKLTPQRIKKNWERKDWWISSDEALEMGLVDEVRSSSLTNGEDK